MGDTIVGYRYRLGLHLVACQGPVDAVQEIKVGDRTAWGDATRDALPAGHGLTRLSINEPYLFGGDEREGGIVGDVDVLAGSPTQLKNDYLTGVLGQAIPAFRGVLSLVARKVLCAANNPYIKPWAVRVRRFNAGWDAGTHPGETAVFDGDVMVGMNPAFIIQQCLTDRNWGMGYPAWLIGDSFQSCAIRLAAERFGLNFLWTRQQPIEAFVGQVLDHIGGILYFDQITGRFELRLLRADYTPDTLPTLGPDEIVTMERFERAEWGELPNEITVVYTDWATGKEATTTARDITSIHLQGGVINQRKDYPGVNYGPLAARLALRDLRALGSPIARITFTVAAGAMPTGVPPAPGAVYKISWPRLAITDLIVRVTGIDFGNADAAEWRIEAVGDVFDLAAAGVAAFSEIGASGDVPTVPPALVVAIEESYWDLAHRLSQSELAYVTVTDSYVGGLAVAGAKDQAGWKLVTGATADSLRPIVSEAYSPAYTLRYGIEVQSETTQIFLDYHAAATRPPNTGELAYFIDISGNPTELVRIETVGDGSHGGPVCSINRGLLDTVPAVHPAGTRLVAAGDFIARDITRRALGEVVYVGAIPKTYTSSGPAVLAGNGQPLTLVGRQGRPFPPGNVAINAVIGTGGFIDITVRFAHRNRLTQTAIAYYVLQTDGDITPEPGTTYTVRIYDAAGAQVFEQSGITDNVLSTSIPNPGQFFQVEIFAVRDGLESWQKQRRTVLTPTEVGNG